MKRLKAALLVFVLVCGLGSSAFAAQSSYPDVPEGNWAAESIEKARTYQLMDGLDDGTFGFGKTISRAEFITVLVRMFGWESVSGEDAAADIATSWARGYINTAAANGVIDAGGNFRPNDAITREEMVVMLVRALGLTALAKADANAELPFNDVTDNKGYVAIAYEIGMTTGGDNGTFVPEGTATREQAAAMLVRIYEKYYAPTAWKHAFYALSSYSQIELAKQFDAVSVGWSRMTYSAENGAALQMSRDNGNEFYLPAGYAEVIPPLEEAGVTINLNVYMSGNSLREMLKSESASDRAVEEIMTELSRSYSDLGYNPYDGVTIDFEGLRAEHSPYFVRFLEKLSARLERTGQTLYVAVMPAVANDIYYDGYDFHAIGELADKVILMAHDYAALDLTGFLNSTYYMNTALTPLHKVYYGIREAAREMDDPSKLVLQISVDALAWQVDANGKLMAPRATRPIHTTIYKRLLQQDSQMGWSDTFRNPYLRYVTEDGQNIFLWYEDERSVKEKLSCAKLLGAGGVSVWRLGLIPNYADEGLHYDVMAALQ